MRAGMIVPVFAIACGMAIPAAAQTEYKLVKTIDLPGDKGGHGDWTTFDSDTRTVWLAQSPDHNVVVIDAATNQVKGVIPGIEDGNGIALSPRYAFLSDNKGGVTIVVDKRSFKKIATLQPEGKGPNGTTYVAKTGNVYISSDSNDMTVFRAQEPFEQVGHFKLRPDPAKDGPDVALYVAAKERLYQPDDNAVDVIDPRGNKIVAVWKPGIEGQAKPIVYDRKTKHFILGTTDLKMLVLDGRNGKVLAAIPVKGKVDETVIDEGARRAFVGDKAGVVEVIDLDHDKVVDTLPSEPNVHTLTVDPKSHTVFVYRNESNKVDVFQRQAVAAK
jgi:DNA-binding beta-propeller fold protein YncE